MCKYVYILQCVYRYAVCKHTHTLYYYRKIPKKALRNATTHSHSTNAPNTSNINPHSREDASTYEVIKSISSRSYCIPVCTAALATSHITNTPNSNTNNTNNSNTDTSIYIQNTNTTMKPDLVQSLNDLLNNSYMNDLEWRNML